jgi:AcrR family transcriptional regulator
MRAVVLRVAAELFAERGFDATSVREVVARAGCTKPTLYYYFRNKEDLFVQVLRESTAAFAAIVQEELSGPGTSRERFGRTLGAMLTYLERDPVTLRLLTNAERHPDHGQPVFDFDSVRRQHMEICTELLRQGAARGELRPDIDIDEAALAFFGMVEHRLCASLQGRPLPPDYAEQALDFFFKGIGK